MRARYGTAAALIASFLFLSVHTVFATNINDPLTNGTTVGQQHGGTFTEEGWKTTSAWDYIQYDVSTISEGYVEFEVRGWHADEDQFSHSHKCHFFGMYDDSYDDRNGDHIKTNPYKCFMRIYGYEPGYSKWGILKLRLNVAAYTSGDETDPNSFEAYASEGGQVENDEDATHWDWQEDEWYHFKLEWGDGHMRWYKDGVLITDYDYSGTGEEYAPPIHIIRLGYVGVYETPIGEVFRNVKIVDATVPVEMSAFNALAGHVVTLWWETASETSNHGFAVERSADSKHYHQVGFVEGHGTTTAPHVYTFQDRPPKQGTYWYRLRQVDVDGSATVYGPVKVLWAPQEEVLLSNYPNPFNGQTRVHLLLPEAADLRVAVYDLTGREVARLHTGRVEAGEHTWTWNAHDELGRELPSGVYLLRATGGQHTLTRRVILLK